MSTKLHLHKMDILTLEELKKGVVFMRQVTELKEMKGKVIFISQRKTVSMKTTELG